LNYGASLKKKPKRISGKFYAVRRGYKTGVFTTWYDCLDAIFNYPRPSFCVFGSMEEANAYMEDGVIPYKAREAKQKPPSAAREI
jgi:ribonuclease HI